MNFQFVPVNSQKMFKGRQGRRSTLEKFADSVKEVKEEVAPLLVCKSILTLFNKFNFKRHEPRDEIPIQYHSCLTLFLYIVCVPLGIYAKIKSNKVSSFKTDLFRKD